MTDPATNRPNGDTNPRYKNGDTIHFDYSGPEAGSNPNVNGSSSKKKKKNKKKNKSKTPASLHNMLDSGSSISATLNNPEDDYPTSRVIKQSPDGEVIVEKIDDSEEDYGQISRRQHQQAQFQQDAEPSHHNDLPPGSPAHTQEVAYDIKKKLHNLENLFKQAMINDQMNSANDLNVPLGNPAMEIWFHNTTAEENQDLKKFWYSLDTPTKSQLSKIDKSDLLSILKVDPKLYVKNLPKEQKDRNLHAFTSQNCTCSNCGRKRNMIVYEIERLYDDHIDEIHSFINRLGDLNDITNLPNVLFNDISVPKVEELSVGDNNDDLPVSNEQGDDVNSANDTEQKQLSDAKSLKFQESFRTIVEALATGGSGDVSQERTEAAIEELREFKRLSKGTDFNAYKFTENMNFIEKMDKYLDTNSSNTAHEPFVSQKEMFDGMLSLLSDISQNNGNAFIDVVESLLNSKNSSEKISDESDSRPPPPNLDPETLRKFQQMEKDAKVFKHKSLMSHRQNGLEKISSQDEAQFDDAEVHHSHHPNSDSLEELDEEAFEEEFGSIYDGSDGYDDEYDDEGSEAEEDDEDEDEDYDQDEEDDMDDQISNAESEISEEEKLQELRHLFLMQVVRVFRQRLKNSYKEKLSQDRTQRLIEELEAEENAKKEKELKKLKQKEKNKEKKRLQQLAKEEERKRKEEEAKAKEEEKKRKEEALKLEQRRRKEEASKKKEEEKRKRIEEQQRKIELQRQKQIEEEKRLADQAEKKREESQKVKKTEEKKVAQMKIEQKAKEEKDKKDKKQQSSSEPVKKVSEDDEVEALLREQEAARMLNEESSISSTVPSVTSQQPFLQELLKNSGDNKGDNPSSATPKLDNQWFGNSLPTNNVSSPSPIAQNPLLPHPQPQSFMGYNNIPPLQDTLADRFSLNGTNPHNMMSSVPSSSGNLSQSDGSNQSQSQPQSQQYTQPPPPGLSQPMNLSQPTSLNQQAGLGRQSMSQAPPGLGSNFSNTNLSSTNLNGFNGLSNGLGGSLNGISGGLNNGFNGVWNSNPGANSGPGPNSGPNTRNSSIWNSNANGSIWNNNNNNGSNSNTSTPNSKLSTVNLHGNETMIKNAAYQAFQIMQSSNQLEFGMAKGFGLFQATNNLLPQINLNFNQFLSSLTNTTYLSNYRFDFTYDDYGTVSYIKVTDTSQGASTSPLLMQSNVHPIPSVPNLGTQLGPFQGQQPQPNVSQTALNQPLNQPLNLNDNLFNGNRSLWN